MQYTNRFKAGLVGSAVLLLALAGPSLAENTKHTVAVQRQVADRLADLKRGAYQLVNEAETLNSHIGKRRNWETHAEHLRSLKDHVNTMGKSLAELEALKLQASESQRMAIECVRPHLVSVAQNLTRAIQLVDQSRDNVHWPEYGENVSDIYAHAAAIHTKVDTILDHEKAKMRLDALAL